jgi:dUTP pyrophosphatase
MSITKTGLKQQRMLEVQIKLGEGAILPRYATPGAAGFDIAANEQVTIEPGETKLVGTGLFFEIPEGYELQVRPRSGVSLKTKLRISNSPGTVDSDYRGEVKIIIDNRGDTPYTVYFAERIAQGVIQKVEQATFNVKTDLSETERGEGGFGHT